MRTLRSMVFFIGGAYKRRESAPDDYGSMKDHGRAIFFAMRDWVSEPDAQFEERARRLLGDLLRACGDLFGAPVAQMGPKEEGVYAAFAEVSRFIQDHLESPFDQIGEDDAVINAEKSLAGLDR